MRENYTLIRLYVDTPLSRGQEVTLPKAQAHYLGTVLRKGEGDELRVFNGQNGEWRAEIKTISKKSAELTLKDQLRPPHQCPDITLCFAPVRKHRTAFIIEKAAELGARTLQPVITARTQFPKLNLDKARLQAIEAAEQTERLDIPTIEPALKLETLLANWDTSRSLIFADESGDAALASEAIKSTTGPAAILIGPEGGFTPQERAMLRGHDFVTPVALGPRILRADTAALSLLTLWQAAQGDWS